MPLRAEAALRAALISTSEALVLAVPDDPPTEAQAAAPLVAAVQVTFRGAADGAVVLCVADPALLQTIATTMLGFDEEPTPTLVADALGELGNVVCGNALPLLEGDLAEFLLDAPRACPPEMPADAVAGVVLGLDTGRLEAYLVRAPQQH